MTLCTLPELEQMSRFYDKNICKEYYDFYQTGIALFHAHPSTHKDLTGS